MIRFRCTLCDKTLKVPENLAGQRVTCPHCQAQSEAPTTSPPEPRVESLAETPGFFSSMSVRLRWLLALVATACGLGLLTAVLGSFLGWEAWVTHGATIVTGCSALSLLAIFHGHGTGCPGCGKWWSRTRVGSEVGDREVFHRRGMTFGRSTTKTEFRCADCGHTWAVTDSEEYRVPERNQTQRLRK